MKWRHKKGWYEWQKRATGGDDQELVESLCYGKEAIIIRVGGEGIF